MAKDAQLHPQKIVRSIAETLREANIFRAGFINGGWHITTGVDGEKSVGSSVRSGT